MDELPDFGYVVKPFSEGFWRYFAVVFLSAGLVDRSVCRCYSHEDADLICKLLNNDLQQRLANTPVVEAKEEER